MHVTHFEIPRLREIARHALPNLVESTIGVVLFLVTLKVVGVWTAIVAGLLWSYAAIARRLVMRQRVPGLLLIGAVTLTARTVLALATGSVFVYFLQPTLGTALVAFAFLVSVPIGHPLAQRLADDFVPLPAAFRHNAVVRRFFLRVSLLWAFTQLANAAVTLWLLLTQEVATFVLARTFLSPGVTVLGIVISTIWFKRVMRRHGIMAST